MNKVILVGKLLDVSKSPGSGTAFINTIGVSGKDDMVDVLTKANHSEFLDSYVYMEGFITERNGYTAIWITLIVKHNVHFKGQLTEF